MDSKDLELSELSNKNSDLISGFLHQYSSLSEKEKDKKVEDLEHSESGLYLSGKGIKFIAISQKRTVGRAVFDFSDIPREGEGKKVKALVQIDFEKEGRDRITFGGVVTNKVPTIEDSYHRNFSHAFGEGDIKVEHVQVPSFDTLNNGWMLWNLAHEYRHVDYLNRNGIRSSDEQVATTKFAYFKFVRMMPTFFTSEDPEEIYSYLASGEESQKEVQELRASDSSAHITMSKEDVAIIMQEETEASIEGLRSIETLSESLELDFESDRAKFCEYAALNLLSYDQFLKRIEGRNIIEYAPMAYQDFQDATRS